MRVRTVFDDEVLRQTGERLREIRQKRGIQTKRLAAELGLSESLIHNAEIGQGCSLSLLHRLADYYDMTLDDLSPVVTDI